MYMQSFNMRMLGIYHNHRDEYYQAKEYLNRSITIKQKTGGIPPIQPLFYLSIALTGLGEYNEAISTGQRCLQNCQEYGFRSVEVWMLNTLGWIYHQVSNIELAKKI